MAKAVNKELINLRVPYAYRYNPERYLRVARLMPLREAFGAHMFSAYNAVIPADHVAITTGCNQAFSAAVMALATAGDNVVMPTPWYFNHQMWLSMLGIEIKAIPAFGAGVNFRIHERGPDEKEKGFDEIAISLGGRYLYGAPGDYLNENSILINGTNVTYDVKHSRTDLYTITLGVLVRF